MESNAVLIHVRFAPNGAVVEIGERPAGTSAQEWFNRLSQHTATVVGRTRCVSNTARGRGLAEGCGGRETVG